MPNATVTYYPDGSYVVKDNAGASYFFSYDNSDPNYSDYYYDPSDYNQRWLADAKPPNMVQIMSLSDRCTIYNSTYTDYSAAHFQAQICKNGSYLFFPSAWSNFSHHYA